MTGATEGAKSQMLGVALDQDSEWSCPSVLDNLQIMKLESHDTTSKLWRNHAHMRNMPRRAKMSGTRTATEQSGAADALRHSQHHPIWPELPLTKLSDRSSKPSPLQSNAGPQLSRRNS